MYDNVICTKSFYGYRKHNLKELLRATGFFVCTKRNNYVYSIAARKRYLPYYLLYCLHESYSISIIYILFIIDKILLWSLDTFIEYKSITLMVYYDWNRTIV